MDKNFRFFPRQFYDGIILLASAYASYQILIACWLNPACVQPGDIADYALWGFIVLATLLLLVHAGKIRDCMDAWKTNWALALFIVYAVASIWWSVEPEQSVHTVFIMIASSLTASIFALIRTPGTIFRWLFGFTLFVGVVSLLTIVIAPEVGIHTNDAWNGAWRGVFQHKNNLGALMTLGNGLSLLAFIGFATRAGKTGAALGYALTLILGVMSRSTTALIVLLILNGLTAVYFAWIKWGDRIQKKSLVYGTGALIGLGAASALGIVYLSGKSLSLTGRVPLWLNLLQNAISEKPWFGYGLETLWRDRDFQKWAAATSGWGEAIVVVNGHNGYIDILLYLGVVGLVLLLLLLVKGFIAALARARSGRTWLNLFPLLTMVYFLMTNLVMDYILEFESFHWFVFVCLCFLPSGVFAESS